MKPYLRECENIRKTATSLFTDLEDIVSTGKLPVTIRSSPGDA
jgi:hypothetical protein